MSFLKTSDVSFLGYIRNKVGHFCILSGLVSMTADVAVESLRFLHRTMLHSVSLGFSPLVGSMALTFSGSPSLPLSVSFIDSFLSACTSKGDTLEGYGS